MSYQKDKKYDPQLWRDEQKRKLDEIRLEIGALAKHYENNPADIAELMDFKANFYSYSYNNTMLIRAQNRGASFVGSYKALKDKGWNVKRGEKAIKILVSVVTTLFRPNGNTPYKQLRDASKKEKELIKNGQMEVIKKLSFKVGNVFDISQTDCPIEQYPTLLGLGKKEVPLAKQFQRLSEYCASIGIAVEIEELESVALQGYFTPDTNKIVINEILGNAKKLSTLAHELGHALLHGQKNRGDKPTALIEVEADTMGIMLEKTFGFDVTQMRKLYLHENYTMLEEHNRLAKENGEPTYDLEQIVKDVSSVFEKHIEPISAYIRQDKELIQRYNQQKEKSDFIAVSDNIQLTNVSLDDDNFLHFTANIEGRGFDGLFHILSPQNGDLELIQMENENLHPELINHWNDITESLQAYYYRQQGLEENFELQPEMEI